MTSRPSWLPHALATLALVLGGVALAVALLDDPVAPGTEPATTAGLADRKLRAETAKLEAETRSLEGFRGFVSTYGVLLTGLVAVGGLFLTFRKQRQEVAHQREADRTQRDREREQRDLESFRHLDERFTTILTELGAESEAVQAGAAVSLLSFLRSEREPFHRQVRLVSLANLKVPHSEAVRRILVGVFEESLRLGPLDRTELDLSHANLDGADLSELDLRGADLDQASLARANLANSSLARSHGYRVILSKARLSGERTDLEAVRFVEVDGVEANFRQARLVSAHLEHGKLARARFQQARLQAAHLEGADLRGAGFEQAELGDAYFYDRKSRVTAVLDEVALRSITRAIDWDKAHFRPEDEERLREIAGR
jgi:uncharacterized protein YjbI with pentapeptide repeats